MPHKIERFDLDASGKPCSEGYYAIAPGVRGVVLMPPLAEMARGLRLATQLEVDAGPCSSASIEHVAGGAIDHDADARRALDG